MNERMTQAEFKATLHKMGVELLNAQERADYEERAAIMEFEGGLTRDEAEGAALSIVRIPTHPAGVARVMNKGGA